jgi:hypothetical protein
MKFKALAGPQQAAAVLINTTSTPGNPGTVTRVFLGGQDFAFGVSAETIKAALQPLLDEFKTKPIPDIKKHVGFPYYSTVTYKVTIFSAVVDLEPGRILITIKGHADDNRWWAPSFDFTAKQAFGLQPDGASANLVVGALAFDTTSTLGLAEFVEGRIKDKVEATRDAFLLQSDVVANVRTMLDPRAPGRTATASAAWCQHDLLGGGHHGRRCRTPRVGDRGGAAAGPRGVRRDASRRWRSGQRAPAERHRVLGLQELDSRRSHYQL